MRTGIVVTVTTADCDRLEAIVADCNHDLRRGNNTPVVRSEQDGFSAACFNASSWLCSCPCHEIRVIADQNSQFGYIGLPWIYWQPVLD
jgi:hypothetical protein